MTFHPREVEPGYIIRWTKQSLLLVLRSPFAFLCSLLPFVLTELVLISGNFGITAFTASPISGGLFPIFCATSLMCARVADVGWTKAGLRSVTRSRRFLESLALLSLLSALGTTGSMYLARFTYAVLLTGELLPDRLLDYGHLWAFSSTIVLLFLGVSKTMFVLPLILFVPVSIRQSVHFSQNGCALSQLFGIRDFLYGYALFVMLPSLAQMIPGYGLPLSVYLAFLVTFLYVGYRDIFEHRSKNAPKTVDEPARSALPNPI